MNDELQSKLKAAGVTDAAIATLNDQELTSEDALRGFTYDQFVAMGIKAGSAKVLAGLYAPPSPVTTVSGPVREEIPEGSDPTPSEVNAFASQMGIDSSMLGAFMMANIGAGAGFEMDMSGFLPIAQIVGSYNPKRRDMAYIVMGQVERRLRSPIVVINADGSVNHALTVKHIQNLENGFPAPEGDIYYDDEGEPREIIAVGEDAQGIYDADPIDPTKALQANGMGVGRVKWSGVALDVRQVIYYAATQTREVSVDNETKLQWLRSNISPKTTRLQLKAEFPNALTKWNEANRTGALPTLRTQLNRSRRPEVMPRRRTLGDNERKLGTGATFRGERNSEYER